MEINNDKVGNIYEFFMTRKRPTDKELLNIVDFHYIAFIRNPILKQAAYIDAQALIPTSTLSVIESELNAGVYPDYELVGYQIQDPDTPNQDDTNIYKIFYKTIVTIISFDISKEDDSTTRESNEASVPVRLLLVHPVAYQMTSNTGFNKIYTPVIKPYEYRNPSLIALETIINNKFNPQYEDSKISSFTDYIIQKYAGMTENIKQFVLGDRNKVNLHSYSTIIVPPTIPEINVPEYIISTYKPFTTPSFWFFDTFNFGNYDNESTPVNGKIPIWCLLINFDNCQNTFKKVDVSEHANITIFTHLLKTVPFTEDAGILNRPNAIVNYTNQNMTTYSEKLGDIPYLINADSVKEKQDARVTSLKVYYPDTLENARNRIIDCMKLFTNQIIQIEHYETPANSPEWLQFGKLYNIEYDKQTGENVNKYVHTPVTIINIFKRRQARDNTLECINKYGMLRLIDPSVK
jgi:hypothetical protein